MYGDVTVAIGGKPFRVELGTAGNANIDITVTMGGVDITATAVHGDVVTIDSVTGDVVITATEFDNFHWYAADTDYVSNPDLKSIYSYNDSAKISGNYGANGVLDINGAQFELSEPAILLHDRPWVLEFSATGIPPSGYPNEGYKYGILLTSDTSASSVNGNAYIHLNQNAVYLGHRDDNYNNTGYNWTEIAAKLGSSSGDLIRNETHTFRMVNKINSDGTNMVYLYVDGVEIGPMNQGASKDSEISGRDYTINYLGSSNHPLRSCNIHYMKIFENGEPVEEPVRNFRWDGIGQSMTSVASDGYFTENVMDLEQGTGINGVHPVASFYSLDKPVTLRHDRSWTLEWKAKGSWGAGRGEDPMLFATSNQLAAYNSVFLWRNSSDFICFGRHLGNNADGSSRSYDNYGISLAPYGLSDTVMYVYRLENVISYNTDGSYASNMVYLYIDDVLIGAMDDHYKNNTAVAGDTENNWVGGKDFVFSYMGTQYYPISDVTFDYIQVWENGSRVDTSRLEYLVANKLQASSDYSSGSWKPYYDAICEGMDLLADTSINQDKVDAVVQKIMATRSRIVTNYSGKTKIHSVELVTGTYARVGKQTGLKITTTPDVAQVCVGTQQLITYSCQIQELNGEMVKVWLVSFQRAYNTEKSVSYSVAAWKTYDAAHGTSDADAKTSIMVHYKSRYVVDLSVTTMPDKTVYYNGDTFDTTGMVVTALMSDGKTQVVSDYFVQEQKLLSDMTSVTINCDGATVTIPVTVYTRVEDARWYLHEGVINLVGYYVGIADEGLNSDKEILLKDQETDSIIAIRTDSFDSVKDQFTIGDFLVVKGTLAEDTSTSTPNKRYLAATSFEKITKPGTLSYNLDSLYNMVNWDVMQDAFQVGNIKDYTYVKLTGTMYLYYYAGSDTGYYLLHMNPDAKKISNIRTDGSRVVCLRQNVMDYNIGQDWLTELFGGLSTTKFPGVKLEGTIYAVYTGAYKSCFQLTILDADWVQVTATAP